MKDKIEGNIEQPIKGGIILRLIDLYNNEFERLRKNLKHGQKFNIGEIKEKEPFKEFFDILKSKNTNLDFDWFIQNLSRLRSWNTFDNIESANDAIADFKLLKIEVPEYVINCYREIDSRTMYINSLIDNKKYQWNEIKISDFNTFINNEFKTYTYDAASRQKYLKDLFDITAKDIKETENQVLKEYGYYIDEFYEVDIFKADKEDINCFFFEGEKAKGTIDEFNNLYRILTNYFDSKNKLKELKKWIIEISSSPLPTEQPGVTLEQTEKSKVNQIALIHVYEGKQITRENAKEIAAGYGWTAKTSGEGLFQDYTFYLSTANRTGKPTPYTSKKLTNKIKLFESVIEHLTDKAKKRANEEIATLKTLYE